MNLNYLEIQGFRSIQKLQRFDFNDLSKGFYFISGENLVNPELGSNGAGKSTFFSDALLWVFEGKTSLNLKASTVKSWYTEEKCEGKIGFTTDNNIDYVLRRCWSPNLLTLQDMTAITSPEEITQERLDDLIGFNHTSLMHSVVVSQFATKFFDLDPAPKLKVFSEILGDVDVWLDYSDKAKTKVSEIASNIYDIDTTLSELRGSLKTLREQDLSDKLENWKTNQEDILKGKTEEIGSIEVDMIMTIADLGTLREDLKQFRKVESDSAQELAISKVKVNKIENTCQEVEKRIDQFETIVNLKRDDLDKFTEVKGICPHCDQTVSEEYLMEKINILETKINEIKKNITNYEGLLLEYNLGHNTQEAVRRKFEKDHTSACTTRNEAESFETRLQDKVKEYEEDIHEKKKILAYTKVEVNPYAELVEQNKYDIETTEKHIKENEDKLRSLEVERSKYEYWVKGYKEIRLLVINEALSEFEIYLNNSLQTLGLGDWKIEVKIDKETGEKTIKKGFYVFVTAPGQKKAVPFEAYCGGERGILRLSATVGLIEFIKSRKNTTCDVEIWDEPTVNLSPSVTDSLLSMLQHRGETRKVLLIDHHKLGSYGQFTGKINVVKDKDGSCIDISEVSIGN